MTTKDRDDGDSQDGRVEPATNAVPGSVVRFKAGGPWLTARFVDRSSTPITLAVMLATEHGIFDDVAPVDCFVMRARDAARR